MAKMNQKRLNRALFHAIEMDSANTQKVHYWVLRGAKLSSRNEQGMTPLHKAVEMENLNAVLLLLGYGANPNAEDSNQNSPLQIAVQNLSNQGMHIVEALLKKNANPLQKNASEKTILMTAQTAVGHFEEAEQCKKNIVNRIQQVIVEQDRWQLLQSNSLTLEERMPKTTQRKNRM